MFDNLQIVQEMQQEYRRAKWGHIGTTSATLAAGGAIAGSSFYLTAPIEVTATLTAVTLLTTLGTHLMGTRALQRKEEQMLSVEVRVLQSSFDVS
jgi:hypothetical protein